MSDKLLFADSYFPLAPSANPDAPGWMVLKFGGTSVAAAANWVTIRKLATGWQDAGYRVLIVHSALAGVSNLLERALYAAVEGEHEAAVKAIDEKHRALCADLGLDGDALLAEHHTTLEQLLSGVRLVREVSPRVHVNVMVLGELMATRIGAAYLAADGVRSSWLDARDVLQSVETGNENERARYLGAMCAFDAEPALDEKLLALPGIVITQGFIARNADGDSVLLGRGGSDTSASYFAAKLQARGLEIWTDVPGMFSADPRKVTGARMLKALSYQQAQEIASMGGAVLHPRCLRPVRQHQIPLRVRCTSRPDLAGTLITSESGSDAPQVKAISSRTGITIVSMETVGMWHEVGFLADAFRCFSDLGISIDLVSTAESNVTVTLDTGAQALDASTLARLRSRLERLCRVTIINNAEVVSLVGHKIRAMLHEIGPALEIFEEYRIHLVSQAASDLNLSFVVEEGQAYRLLQQLHAYLVSPTADDRVFGPTWESLQQKEPAKAVVHHDAWWLRKKSQLLDIAAENVSAYVYDRDSVRAACARLTRLTNVDQVYYAIKANCHAEVLHTVEQTGVNMECVSPGEIAHVLELFPDIERQRILFTPNFAPREEYIDALEAGVRVTLDNLHPLRHWGEDFRDHDIILRLDTGHGRGHHEHVRTAGVHSKFGIPAFEIDEAIDLLGHCGARVIGLHAHTGSGVLRADNWQDVADSLLAVAQRFPELRFLDLGGGLGVPVKSGDPALDMAALDESLAQARGAFPDYELWLEPGRYIVAEAGVLLATVTQVKGKGEVRYVGVSTGMNSLIRPALYGAFHEIVNLSRHGEPASQMVNVVGPICETGDRLGSDRRLPECHEGDVLLIANAGAYGYVMSSNYNLRAPAAEFVI